MAPHAAPAAYGTPSRVEDLNDKNVSAAIAEKSTPTSSPSLAMYSDASSILHQTRRQPRLVVWERGGLGRGADMREA